MLKSYELRLIRTLIDACRSHAEAVALGSIGDTLETVMTAAATAERNLEIPTADFLDRVEATYQRLRQEIT